MQLRCTYCQTMFAISREDMLAALEHMEENKLVFYDAHCPKCRRANRVERARMVRFFPDWKTAIKTMEKASELNETSTEKPAAKPKAAAPAVKKAESKLKVKPAAKPKAAAPAVKKAESKLKVKPAAKPTAAAPAVKNAAPEPKTKPAAAKKK
jgi:hypothetical protein